MKNKRILFISPHTDDVELSCGATLARCVREGVDVFYLALTATDNWKELIEEATGSMEIFGISHNNYEFLDFKDMYFPEQRRKIMEKLEDYRNNVKPDIVFCPSRNDIHQDHQETTMCALRVFKWSADIYGYNVSWNMVTEPFNPTHFIEVSKEDVITGLDAVKRYRTQANKSYVNEHAIVGRARASGVQVGVEYAESFETYRQVKRL